MKTIAVLALQGAFIEHEKMFRKLGCDVIELREKADLNRPFDALVLPGGESTTQGKLLQELGMLDPLQRRIRDGLPVMATCAGLILLAEHLENDPARYFATLPVTVRRNAYGRQLGSFHAEEDFTGIGQIPMTFIRAPYVTQAGEGVQVLAEVARRPEGFSASAVASDSKEKGMNVLESTKEQTPLEKHIVAVRCKNQLALSFHPELDQDTRVHAYFLREFVTD